MRWTFECLAFQLRNPISIVIVTKHEIDISALFNSIRGVPARLVSAMLDNLDSTTMESI